MKLSHETRFYKKGAFRDQIILDQNWVIDAVYQMFDPNKEHRSVIQDDMGGNFTRRYAKQIWSDEDAAAREVYIDFMHIVTAHQKSDYA